MKLLVVGATGGTGRKIVELALERGHDVTALVRRPERAKLPTGSLTIIPGNVLDPESLDTAVAGQEAVLCALGHKRYLGPSHILSRGTSNLVASMKKHRVNRLVCVTSLSIGDSAGKLGLYYNLFVIPFITFFYFRDKSRQEAIVRASDLDWTIVRPGQLTNGRKRESYKHGEDLGSYILTLMISRASVADFMLKQLSDRTYLRKAVAVVN